MSNIGWRGVMNRSLSRLVLVKCPGTSALHGVQLKLEDFARFRCKLGSWRALLCLQACIDEWSGLLHSRPSLLLASSWKAPLMAPQMTDRSASNLRGHVSEYGSRPKGDPNVDPKIP